MAVDRFLTCAIMLSLTLSGCLRKEHSRPLTNDAYVWQRHWDNALLTALTESASAVRAWRVLAAEADANANWTVIPVNRQALKQTAKPVVVVVRIDGRRGTNPLDTHFAPQIAALAAGWKKDGLPVLGIEIDYDCATSRIPDYRNFLRVLRSQIRRDMALSITALPSWMGSRDLPELLAEVDETVLQVHSVMNPQKGLFDRETAYRWAQSWSALSPVPFRMALPTYWSRVTWNEDGRVAAIESEVSRYGAGPDGRELVVEPVAVNSLILELHRAPLRRLAGIAWFRLPTTEDGRAWTAGTWHAVMEGRALGSAPLLVRFQADPTGANNVYVLNRGDLDAKLPAEVSVSGEGCELADALPPYDFECRANGVRFRLKSDNLLPAGRERLVGWIRCSGKNLKGHVSF